MALVSIKYTFSKGFTCPFENVFLLLCRNLSIAYYFIFSLGLLCLTMKKNYVVYVKKNSAMIQWGGM